MTFFFALFRRIELEATPDGQRVWSALPFCLGRQCEAAHILLARINDPGPGDPSSTILYSNTWETRSHCESWLIPRRAANLTCLC